jgi:hypothetical protein
METADLSNRIRMFFVPTLQPLSAPEFLGDQRVLSAVIIMPLMTFIFIRLAIFLDGAGISTLKAKFALWKRQQKMNQNADVAVTMQVMPSHADQRLAPQPEAVDEDVAAEAAKICAGHVEENVPILLQNLTKTFVDENSGLEMKAVQGVSFEVPVSQVVGQGRRSRFKLAFYLPYLAYCRMSFVTLMTTQRSHNRSASAFLGLMAPGKAPPCRCFAETLCPHLVNPSPILFMSQYTSHADCHSPCLYLSGIARVCGHNVALEPLKAWQSSGFCPQFDALFENLTVQVCTAEHVQSTRSDTRARRSTWNTSV